MSGATPRADKLAGGPYGEAVEALRRCQASPGDDLSVEVHHFGQLVAELEQEILTGLAANPDDAIANAMSEALAELSGQIATPIQEVL